MEWGWSGHYVYIGIKDGIYYLANDSELIIPERSKEEFKE